LRDVTYLDASAILKLVVHEPESSALRAYLAPRLARATSVIGVIETRRTARRLRDDAAEQVAFVIDVIALEDELVATAATVRPERLRSLDAIHVASAIDLGSDLEVLVSYDARMIEAATAAGLPVASPGR
jgi:predicted nucleic acid-binding protein